jgi:prepilin-type N-terminal cleavage/methylation domain-containing protein
MKNIKGFSLVELLITMAITGLIFTVIGGMVYQLNVVADYGNDKLTACHELQNLSNRFYIDGYEATSAESQALLSLQLATGKTVIYALSGTDLVRTEGSSPAVLVRNVDNVNFRVQNRMITMNITSQIPGRLQDRQQATYQVYMRQILQ